MRVIQVDLIPPCCGDRERDATGVPSLGPCLPLIVCAFPWIHLEVLSLFCGINSSFIQVDGRGKYENSNSSKRPDRQNHSDSSDSGSVLAVLRGHPVNRR